MIIRKANVQDIKALLHSFPGVKSVLCTGVDGYTLLAMDNNNLIAFASVFKREIPAPLKGKKEDFIVYFYYPKKKLKHYICFFVRG